MLFGDSSFLSLAQNKIKKIIENISDLETDDISDIVIDQMW